MSRTQPRIVKATSNAHSVGLLTAGLVTVSRGSRFVFVEDEDDVEFYRVIHDVLTDSGPSKDRMAIDSIPSVVFLAASIKGGSKPQSGGKDSVIRWVGKLDQSPLDEIFRGVIDLDAGNIAPPRVFVIGRYSIENYLLDPIVVFGLLLSFGIEPKVAGLNISSGDEHQLRSMPAAKLQLIVDEVHRIVAPTLSNVTPADSVLRDVAFTTGMVLQYPAWMLDRQGHGLFPVYQAAFGGPKVVSPPALRKMWRRVRVVPVELANLLRVLQH
jgi:hypothetical protein